MNKNCIKNIENSTTEKENTVENNKKDIKIEEDIDIEEERIDLYGVSDIEKNMDIRDLEDSILVDYKNFRLIFTKRSIDAKKKSDLDGLSKKFGFSLDKLGYNRQIHSSKVRLIDEDFVNLETDFYSEQSNVPEADALVTDIEKLALLVFTADCVPVVLLDPKKGVIANIHAGWRGSYSNIVRNSLICMKENYGIDFSDVVAVIGPSIGSCCYEVGKDLIEKFRQLIKSFPCNYDFEKCYRVDRGSYYLDLQNINEILLRNSGVKQENIVNLGICTSCKNEEYYSYRLDDKTSSRIGTIVFRKSI